MQFVVGLMFGMMNMRRIIPDGEEILSKDFEKGKKRVSYVGAGQCIVLFTKSSEFLKF